MHLPKKSFWKIIIIQVVCYSWLALSGTSNIWAQNMEGNLVFTENKNQWPQQVNFQAKLKGGTIFFERHGLTLNLYHPGDFDSRNDHHNDQSSNSELSEDLRCHAYKVHFAGSLEPVIKGRNQLEGISNYFIGNEKSKWGVEARSFKSITYQGIYKNIDFSYYQSGKHLKYDIHVHPGGHVNDIRLQYQYTDNLEIVDGNLVIHNSVNTVIEHRPVAFQVINGKQKAVSCSYRLQGQEVTFSIDGYYNPNFELVIDPILRLATYSGSTADNFGFTATYDDAGNLYGGGIVFGLGYPTTNGAYNTNFTGQIDIGITKFNPTGTSLIYSTYIGGLAGETPHSLVVNDLDELYVFGITGSNDYPTTTGAYDITFGGGLGVSFPSNGTSFLSGTDIIVSKLSSTGTALLGSTYLGGSLNDGLNNSSLNFNYGDLFRGEIIVDAQSNVYIATCTNSGDFPVTAGAAQTTLSGTMDACVIKFNSSLTALTWATFLGGTNVDAAYSLKLDNNDNVYVAGGTASLDFPTTPGVVNFNVLGGNADGFLSKIESNGAVLISSTYIGTPAYDQCYFVEVDDYNEVYVTGQTFGVYFVTSGVYTNPLSGQFISGLNSTLSLFNFSTVFGKGDGNPELAPTAFLVDHCQNIYFSGWGGAVNGSVGNTTGLPLKGAYQTTTDGSDFYFIVLSRHAKDLVYATYFGGGLSSEHVDGGTSRFDKNGIIYQAVCAGCGGNDDFPSTLGAWSTTNNSFNCNMGVLKFEFELNQVDAIANAGPSTTGCQPLTIQFENLGTPGLNYFWDFDDGDTSILENPVHTFTQPGAYTVMYIVGDSSDCNNSDTDYVNVTVYAQSVAGFSYDPLIIKPGTLISFTDESKDGDMYDWDFGDGNFSSAASPTHSYDKAGVYTVCQMVNNAGNCPDTLCRQIIVPIIDVPTAFTPNGDSHNDMLYVRGIGVLEFQFRLYNRWGELIFETNDLNKGWDGTHKSEQQEMEVYVYFLDAVLENGESVSKKGNITLIR